MPKTKRSKRIPLNKQYKIKRKVLEHHRKIRRIAKKNAGSAEMIHKKREPPIPNSYPFKEEMLKAAVLEKEKKEEARLAAIKTKREERSQKKSTKLPVLKDFVKMQEDAAKRAEVFQQREAIAEKHAASHYDMKDNSKKAYFKEFKKVVEMADVIIEVLDARDPMGCRCVDVEHTINQKYPGKKIVLLLNKIDLVPKEIVEKWVKYLRNEYPTLAFKSSIQNQRRNIGQSTVDIASASKGQLQANECLGADTLVQLIKNYSRNQQMKTSISVGIIGYPNVGKSSVINSLKRSRAVGVGATPGFTKAAQEIHLDKNVKLIDSPGIVFSKVGGDQDDNIVLRNAIKIEQIPDPIGPIEAILTRCKKEQLMNIYKIPTYENSTEFLAHIAKLRGRLGKGGVINVQAAARSVLQDWVGGKIPFFTEPPEVSNVHMGAQIVGSFSKEFDIDQSSIFAALSTSKEGVSLRPGQQQNSDERLLGDDEDESMEVGEDEEEASDDQDAGPSEDSDEEMKPAPAPVAASKKSTKQNMWTPEDDLNPQLNQTLKAKQKKENKKQKKLNRLGVAATKKPVKAPVADSDDEDYDFATDFNSNREDDIDDADIDI